MKRTIVTLFICLAACSSNSTRDAATNIDTAGGQKVIPAEEKSVLPKDTPVVTAHHDTIIKRPATHSNKRFKDVVVTKQDDSTFIIKGKAQVFEAAFSWVIEDGHEELQKGFSMTDAGAPEWGKFSFTVKPKKKRNNSVLHLILFESSAKDGSRQYQLPVLLD